MEALNELYTDDNRHSWGRSEPEVFAREYIRLLKTYAIARKTDPFHKTVRLYTGGNGILRKNKMADKPKDPVAVGFSRCPWCGEQSRVAAWADGDEAINLSLKLTPERR